MQNREIDNILEKLEEEFQKIHNTINKDLPKELIYHYTSYDGLKKIIETKRLRHTDYRYLNDPTELKYGERLVRVAILNSKIPHFRRDLFISALNTIFDKFDDMYKIYVSCFSEGREKLNLWRYYALNGAGFAIAFNKNFQRIVNPLNRTGRAMIYKVIYDEEDSKEIINKFINAHMETIEQNKIPHSSNEESGEFHKLDGTLATHLISLLPLFKDKSFEDEHEIRSVYMEGEGVIDPDTKKPFYFGVVWNNRQNWPVFR